MTDPNTHEGPNPCHDCGRPTQLTHEGTPTCRTCGGTWSNDSDSDDVFVVFAPPYGEARDIKRVSRSMAEAWYPSHPRATFEQWKTQTHPALEET